MPVASLKTDFKMKSLFYFFYVITLKQPKNNLMENSNEHVNLKISKNTVSF